MILRQEKERCFAALITAIILSLILIIVTVTLNRSGFFARSAILEAEYKEMSVALAEACVDIAMLHMATTPGYTVVIPIVENINSRTCTIESITGYTIQTSADTQGSMTKLEVELNSDLSVLSWEEVVAF